MVTFHDRPITGKPCKFIKVAGHYRFFPKNIWDSHRDAVGPTEIAEAAGTLVEYDDHWVLLDDYSPSLTLGCQPAHHRELEVLLGKPEREN